MSIFHSCIMTLCLSMLESDDFYTRQLSDTYLQKVGYKAYPHILIGTESKDLEVRKRCIKLLKLIGPVKLEGRSWTLLMHGPRDGVKYHIKFNDNGLGILTDTVVDMKVDYQFKWRWDNSTLVISPTTFNSIINSDEIYHSWEYIDSSTYKCKFYHQPCTLTVVE